MRFRTPHTQEQLDYFAFRYGMRQGDYVSRGFDDGLGWYRMRSPINSVWMSTVLNRDPSVCQAMAMPDTNPPFQPPPADEGSDCVPVPTEEKTKVGPGNFSVVLEYVDRYPWFIDVVNAFSDSAGGMSYTRLYSDGTFERVPTCLFCEALPSP